MKQNKSDILTDLVLAVFRLNGAMINWGDDFSASAGLSSARWQMLGAIALAEQPLSAPQIAERMGVTRQGAQKQLNLLAEAGLIELIANPGPKRSPLHALTVEGRRVYQSIDARWRGHAEQVAARFGREDLATARELLAALTALHAAAPGERDAE